MNRKPYKSGKNQHKNIAKARGERWKKNLIIGRREAMLNPTLIRLARLKKGLQQEDCAEKLKISTSAWAAIERGRQKIKFESASKIAKIFGKPVNLFFSGDNKTGKFIATIQKSVI